MNYPSIGIYHSIGDTESKNTIPLDIFLSNVRDGEFQDLVLPIRISKDKDERSALKKRLPNVTISGVFSLRFDKNLVTHSGFIAIDVDNLGDQVENFKAMISGDPYTYAAFTSVSGMGLCIVARVEADRHRDAYLGLAAYYLSRFKQPVDPTGINVSRARFVSYDPHLVWNERSQVFKKYLPKEKKTQPPPVVFVQTEFDDIVRQMVDRRVSCCEDYRDWLKVCFALCNRFGESGRHYFHSLSSISGKYDPQVADKQYTVSLGHENMWIGQKATLSTVYYYAKLGGINIASEKTKHISAATTALKKSGLSIDTIVTNLQKFEGINPEDSRHIVAQAYDSGTDFHNDSDCLIDSLLTWLRNNYSLRLNLVTRRIENAGVSIDDMQLNSIFLNAKRVFDDLTFELFNRCVFSNNTATYNPFLEWWDKYEDTPYADEIMKFWRCIPVGSAEDFDRMVYFGTKWLVSIVASIYGTPSPLVLVLAGEKQGTGKTEVFRHLFPMEWRQPVDYYAESKLDGKEADDAVLMCTKLLIMDDEFGGQSKKEQRRFKSITSKNTFSVRKPYGRNFEDLFRLAVMGGTCQELEVLNDPTGNRRLLPFHVVSKIDYEAMNQINRTAMFAQLFRMYHSGFNFRVINNDIEILAKGSDMFLEFTLEYDLVNSYFDKPAPNQFGVVELTAGEIKERLDKYTGQRTSLNKVGQELKRLGFEQVVKKTGGKTCRVYLVIEKKNITGLPALNLNGGPSIPQAPTFDDLEDPPF